MRGNTIRNSWLGIAAAHGAAAGCDWYSPHDMGTVNQSRAPATRKVKAWPTRLPGGVVRAWPSAAWLSAACSPHAALTVQRRPARHTLANYPYLPRHFRLDHSLPQQPQGFEPSPFQVFKIASHTFWISHTRLDAGYLERYRYIMRNSIIDKLPRLPVAMLVVRDFKLLDQPVKLRRHLC